MSDPLKLLSDEGVAVWLDDMSRERLVSGNLKALVRDKHVVGVTTNPTIFHKAITGTHVYDEQIANLAALDIPVAEAIRLLTTHDVRAVCDLLRPVYDATDGLDGRVSIEVDPGLAEDTRRTSAEAELLWWMVDRPNLMVKIPATEAGLPAITAALAAGISVNVTLIFSVQRYEAVMDAYLDGLEQAHAAGRDLARIGSVASFFISRVDSEVDARLNKIGSDEALALRGWRRSLTRDWPTSGSSRCSTRNGGSGSRPSTPARSGPCGRQRGSRTPPTTTRAMSSSSWRRAR